MIDAAVTATPQHHARRPYIIETTDDDHRPPSSPHLTNPLRRPPAGSGWLFAVALLLLFVCQRLLLQDVHPHIYNNNATTTNTSRPLAIQPCHGFLYTVIDYSCVQVYTIYAIYEEDLKIQLALDRTTNRPVDRHCHDMRDHRHAQKMQHCAQAVRKRCNGIHMYCSYHAYIYKDGMYGFT